MSDRFFVDTNILVYAHDNSAGTEHKRSRTLIEDLWHARSGVISTQVLQELCNSLQRKVARQVPRAALREIITDYLELAPRGERRGLGVVEALDLQERHQISFWDALIVRAAQVSNSEILYSEDLSDGQSYGGVRVVNPLKEDSERASHK